MDNQEFINFKKTRDLGSILSDTFKFISTEFKPFFVTIFKASIIPVLIAICAVIYYLMTSTSFFGSLSLIDDSDTFYDFNFSQIVIPLLIFIVSYVVAYAAVTVASLSYIKSYIENKGQVNYTEIQQSTKEKLLPYVGLFFLISIIIFFGILFCFIPGIYLAVVLSLSICLLIFQDKGVFDAINDSFSFIKNHWWETFGILLTIQILIGIISFLISLPASIYQGLDISSALQNPNSTEILNSFSDPIYLLLIAFSHIIEFILYIISTVAIVFVYYDIKEQKNPSSHIIDEIGRD
ncbi:hypothetical protein [uncultured Polaribacter sp.]|uniref:hypothetical protein n=1 Tax=uncultured Polaribacter sp. TaxID=174711 RepID=UPI00261DD7C0|nr:hypothetical protein [uncultured Polaribacter sp.]